MTNPSGRVPGSSKPDDPQRIGTCDMCGRHSVARTKYRVLRESGTKESRNVDLCPSCAKPLEAILTKVKPKVRNIAPILEDVADLEQVPLLIAQKDDTTPKKPRRRKPE